MSVIILFTDYIMMSNYDVKCAYTEWKEKEFSELAREEIWNLVFKSKTRPYQPMYKWRVVFVCALHKVPSWAFRYMVIFFLLYFSVGLPILMRIKNVLHWLSFYCIINWLRCGCSLFHCYCSQIISICIDKYDLDLVNCCLPREIVNLSFARKKL